MGGKFWFFTDVDRLAAQGAAEAFGPVVGSEAIQFRVTDLHTAAGTNAPRAYAICDGLLRAQLDDEGGLTLILKPSQQPPFDFPPVAFFLYKGVRPDSLLKSAAPWPLVDPAKATQSPLVARIVQDWQANGNGGEPGSESLGLHLNPATAAFPGFDPSLYSDDQPLDNFFYHGDGLFPPRLISGGEAIGEFAVTRLGLEVVIDRIGRPPAIKLARKRETIVSARAMPGGTPAADDSEAFMSRHERDAILGFIDPCAFWGSFLLSGLAANGISGGTSVAGANIYAQLLAGPAGPKFWNRHKAYVDIRNDHGHSLNYYRETADEILAALDPSDPLVAVSYYVEHDWPSFTAPGGWLSSAALGSAAVSLQLSLPAAIGSKPITYISTGFVAKGNQLAPRKGQERFFTAPLQANGFTPPIALTVPLALPNSTPQIHASYQKLHQFRRGGVALSMAPPSHGVAPFFYTNNDHLFPVPGAAPLPRQIAKTAIRAYGDLFFIGAASGAGGCVARPGIARDTNNLYLFLLPVALSESGGVDLRRPALPAFEESGEFQFRPDLLLESGPRLVTRDVQDATGSGTANVTLIREQAAPIANVGLSDNFQAIAMDETEYAGAVFAPTVAVPGTATLSVGAAALIPATVEKSASTISYVKPAASGSTTVTRVHSTGFKTLYRDASV